MRASARQRRARRVAAASLVAVTAVAAGSAASAAEPGQAARASAPAAEPVAGAAAKSTRAVVERLPIAKLVGQRVIVSYEGAEPPQQLFDLIRKGYVAGVIFFGANTNEDPALTRQVAMRMQRARLAAKPKALRRPLLLMTDQEGGLVRRLPGEPELSEWQISARRNAAGAAGKAGAGAARTLAAAGINVNLAPVLGVQRPGSSFLGQFQRAYARWRNPRKVGKLAKAFVTQLQRRGVAATSKHFPGLGAATEKQDTDAAPVTLRLSQRTIDRIDLVPYPWVIAARTKLVMVNNAVYPSLDPTRPASLSRPIIEGILRRRLGYRGVTITDALEAGALAPFGGIPHRGVLAAEAGDDLLLFSQQKLIEGINGSEALRTALRSGRLDRDRFERAALRVLKLRGQLQVKPSRPLP